MILLPEGDFIMGDNSIRNAAPAHTVAVRSFYIDRLEVSNRHYREFCGTTRRPSPAAPSWDSQYFTKDEYPVINVTWEDARAFCESAGKRLPSEAEWEKSARGTEFPLVVWGNWRLPGLANIKGPEPGRPSLRGSFTADVSPFGILDMAGNVQEWVADDYRLYEGNPAKLSPEESDRRVLRGGSFAVFPEQLSPSWREAVAANAGPSKLSAVGFRCAADVSIALNY